MKIIFTHFFIFVFIFNTFCSGTNANCWKKTEQKCFVWTDYCEEEVNIQWDGKCFYNHADGKGNLRILDSNNNLLVEHNELFLGSYYHKSLFDQEIYIGEVRNNQRNGYGVNILKDRIDIGFFKDNVRHGTQKSFKNRQIFYEGQYSQNKRNGKGKLYSNNYVISGQWKNGKLFGAVQQKYANGVIYRFKYLNGEPDYSSVEITYKNGNRYYGSLVDGRKNGTGEFYYSNCDSYKGGWVDDKKQGRGKWTLSNGTAIEGEWNDDILSEALCKVTYESGNSYQGSLREGLREGEGEFRIALKEKVHSQNLYNGSWKEDKRNGFGVQLFPSGDKYEGEWDKDEISGKGNYVTVTGKIYSGEWKSGLKHGLGELILPDGKEYIGGWKNNVISGHGLATFPDGSYYDGEWENFKKNGFGRYVWGGEFYVGLWENDLQSKFGKYVWGNGDYYDGEWKNGIIEGYGVYQHHNGDYYTGDWENNKKNGFGEYETHNGTLYIGEFENDQPNGKGSIFFDNGNRYEGNIVNGKIKGKGSFYVLEHDINIIYSGVWLADRNFPKVGSLTFDNGDMFIGDISEDGHPVNNENSIWINLFDESNYVEDAENKNITDALLKVKNSFNSTRELRHEIIIAFLDIFSPPEAHAFSFRSFLKQSKKKFNSFVKKHKSQIVKGALITASVVAAGVVIVTMPASTPLVLKVATAAFSVADVAISTHEIIKEEDLTKAGKNAAIGIALQVIPFGFGKAFRIARRGHKALKLVKKGKKLRPFINKVFAKYPRSEIVYSTAKAESKLLKAIGSTKEFKTFLKKLKSKPTKKLKRATKKEIEHYNKTTKDPTSMKVKGYKFKVRKNKNISHNKKNTKMVKGKKTTKTNCEWMRAGKAPIGKDGFRVELHHHAQRNVLSKGESYFVELTEKEHRLRPNYQPLHPRDRISKNPAESKLFNDEFKSEYWKKRAGEICK